MADTALPSAVVGGGTEPLIVSLTKENVPCSEEFPEYKGAILYTYSHSWQEIRDALASGRPVFTNSEEFDPSVEVTSLVPVIDAAYNPSDNSRFVDTLLGNEYPFADATSLTFLDISECDDK